MARIQLSVLDHNENVEREGMLLFQKSHSLLGRTWQTTFIFSNLVVSCKSQYSKATKEKVLKWVKAKKTYTFRREIMQAVITAAKIRDKSVRQMAKGHHQRLRDDMNLPQNVRGDHLPGTSAVAEQLLGKYKHHRKMLGITAYAYKVVFLHLAKRKLPPHLEEIIESKRSKRSEVTEF